MAERRSGENSRKPAGEGKAAVAGKPAASKRTTSAPKAALTLEQLKREIAVRAHQLYEERIAAGRPGDDLADWLAAEAEVKKRHKLK